MFFAPSIVDNQGYVFISIGNYTIELSVIVAIGIILLTFILLLVCYQVLHWLFSCKKIFGGFFDKRREATARENLYLGVIALLEQRYEEAHKLLISNTHSKHRSVASYIIAAQAAIQSKNEKACLNALDKAQKLESRSTLACQILKSDLYVKLDNLEKSAEILEKARATYDNNATILRKLSDLYIKLEDYEKLGELIPSIKACKAFPFDDFLKLQVVVYNRELQKINDVDPLKAKWDQVSRSLRKQPVILGLFARKFAELEDHKTAEKILLEGLRKLNESSIYQEISKCSYALPNLLDKLVAKNKSNEKDQDVDYLRALANQYFAKKDYPLALEIFKKIVDLDGNKDDFIKIAHCYESARLFEKSNISLKKVIV